MKSVSVINWHYDSLQPMRHWLESTEIHTPDVARLICKLIPARCPFERNITLFNHTLLRIPPLCKLNPFYDQLVELRFKALCYLADELGEDISLYC
ncbi:Mo-dependent nitrogenase C-terminal domain-containing protein [Neosynechococcus sphagnicola]|uniref:Mo-dependent nitrogenase C-terminal domain-containing protein n=1 Tax=Neosynechococcus sphagnicola TaxID=1501145 RepID=UPI00055B0203|nr:Mo-dependent nitrogenase C-terminal domain-containing protein [Neosynechococcus sphagnicola]